MVVARERAQRIEDLVEQITWPELLHDLAIDAGPYLFDPLHIDTIKQRGDVIRDCREHARVPPCELLAPPRQHQRGPPSTAPPQGHDQQVKRNLRSFAAQEARQQPPVPLTASMCFM